MAGLLSVFVTLMASEATWGVEMYKVTIIFLIEGLLNRVIVMIMNLRCFQEWRL